MLAAQPWLREGWLLIDVAAGDGGVSLEVTINLIVLMHVTSGPAHYFEKNMGTI